MINLFPHSLHLLQPLDVGCFSILKHCYSQELEVFIKAHINYITKIEFFITFHKVYIKTMTKDNIKAGFRGDSLISFDSQAVFSKLDVKLHILMPTEPPNSDLWISQIPQNSVEALSQTELVRTQISRY